MDEQWLPIPGYEGKYEVSDLGRVRSLRFTNGKVDRLRAKPKVLSQGGRSYRAHVDLCLSGHITTRQVHTLVLLAFVGPCPDDKDVCAHWDGDQNNNGLTNLRWATHAENEADKARHGRTLSGSRNHRTQLSNEQVIDIRRRLWAGEIGRRVAESIGLSPSAVSAIGTHQTFVAVPGSPPPIRLPRRGPPSGVSAGLKELRA